MIPGTCNVVSEEASQEWQSVQLEETQNEQLLDLSKQILELTDAIHRLNGQAHGRIGSGDERRGDPVAKLTRDRGCRFHSCDGTAGRAR